MAGRAPTIGNAPKTPLLEKMTRRKDTCRAWEAAASSSGVGVGVLSSACVEKGTFLGRLGESGPVKNSGHERARDTLGGGVGGTFCLGRCVWLG